jgi:acyl carrier protein
MSADWTPTFERVMRANLRLLADDEELDPHVPLSDLGLDSMRTIQLMLELEAAFGVTFPDESLTPETFATAEALWKVLGSLPSTMDSETHR